jgi:hypothetical protein
VTRKKAWLYVLKSSGSHDCVPLPTKKTTGGSEQITIHKGGSTMANIKRSSLVVLSVVFLLVGVLGIADVKFFSSNTILELVEIAMGICGLVIVAR